ncbi:MAG: GtrA family protein [Actinomycetaceae bacterium]|nr:GtrA family protein [Actinomycetaceae bacterium]
MSDKHRVEVSEVPVSTPTAGPDQEAPPGGVIARLLHTFLHGSSVWRYLVVGVGTSLLDLGLFSLMAVGFTVPPVPANIISTVITVCVSYLINQSFVFKSAGGPTWKSFFSFAGLTLFTGTIFQSAVIWGIVESAALLFPTLPGAIVKPTAKVFAMGVGAVCNYLGYRWLFSDKGKSASASGASSE